MNDNLIKDKVMIDLDRYEALMAIKKVYDKKGGLSAYFEDTIWVNNYVDWRSGTNHGTVAIHYPKEVEKENLENAFYKQAKEEAKDLREKLAKQTDEMSELENEARKYKKKYDNNKSDSFIKTLLLCIGISLMISIIIHIFR